MKWAEMSEDQRNMLIAEKVMGWTAGICDGEWGEQPFSGDGWYCMKCGYEGHWGAGFEHEKVPPRYTVSMNAAWLVVEHFRGATLNALLPCVFSAKIYKDSDCKGGEAIAENMPEAICLAALRASGIEIEE